MLPLTDERIRASFINASLRERKALTLPELDDIRWGELDYLGWRDPKYPQLGYVVAELGGSAVGVLLRQSEGRTRSRPQCSWCEDVLLPNDVVLFVAKRAGDAGRKGDTVGTLVCSSSNALRTCASALRSRISGSTSRPRGCAGSRACRSG